RQPVLVLEPPALLRFRIAPVAEPFPVVLDLVLRLAVYLERHRFVEFEDRPAIERRERLAVELEAHHHDGTWRPMMELLPRARIACDRGDARILEDLDVVRRRFFGLIVEPEAGGEAWGGHGVVKESEWFDGHTV